MTNRDVHIAMALMSRRVFITILAIFSAAIHLVGANQTELTLRSIGCKTPKGGPGTCSVIESCKYVYDLIKLQGIRSPEVTKYLKSSKCGFDGIRAKICCPKNVQPISNNNNNNNNNQKIQSQFPDQCGQDLNNRIVGGEMTELGEFPWMVLIDYEHSQGVTSGCGGVLINKRYVLTAAHCIKAIPSDWKMSGVRLGEYDTRTNPDCMNEGNGQRKCANPIQFVRVERQIPHENYGWPQRYGHDIALLKLTKDVEFTEYIKPICLPTIDSVSENYWAAGWGQTAYSSKSSIKLKVKLPYVDYNECVEKYSGRGISVRAGQFCVGGLAGKDTCKGDSGGPLMRQNEAGPARGRWSVEGIVSIGYSPCGTKDWPAVYARVRDYMPWIQAKMNMY